MPGSSRKVPAWLPILVILIAMVSIQSGASLAKSLFPLIGAPGVTALRLTLGTLILVVIFKPWRLRFARSSGYRCSLRRGARGDELSLLFIAAADPAWRRGRAGVHRAAGGGALRFTPPA